MTEPLDLARFQALADAYGGVVARWPNACRDAASRLAGTSEGKAILERASTLDVQLDGWRLPAPSADIMARIAVAAPRRVQRPGPRLRWWFIGTAATLAGAAAGTAAVAMVAPVEVGSGTSFGDLAGVEG